MCELIVIYPPILDFKAASDGELKFYTLVACYKQLFNICVFNIFVGLTVYKSVYGHECGAVNQETDYDCELEIWKGKQLQSVSLFAFNTDVQ